MKRTAGSMLAALLLLALSPAASGQEAPAAAQYKGAWVGQTKQDKEITFTVDGKDRIIRLKVTIVLPGSGCSSDGVGFNFGRLRVSIKDDAFRVSTGDGVYTYAVVKGTFTSDTKAKGTAEADMDLPGSCSGHAKTKWTATLD